MQRVLILLFFFVLCNCKSSEKATNVISKNIVSDYEIVDARFFRDDLLISFWSLYSRPDIVICDDIVTAGEANAALNFWKDLGYRFGSVRRGDQYIECMPMMPARGTIRIRLLRSDEISSFSRKIAATATFAELRNQEIVSADIICQGFILEKKLTIEHEIGHALGWGHIQKTGHIMHPEWVHIGENSEFVDYSNYQSIVRKKNH